MKRAIRSAIVTGGLGFLGSHLVDRLVQEDMRVTVIDNQSTGSTANVAHHETRITQVNWDVSSPWPDNLVPKDIDVLFHLGSPASPHHYQRLSIPTLLTNSYGTRNALDWCRRAQARFLFASTSEVYGDPDISPQSESYWGRVNPVGPRACYDESKRFGEALTMEYVRQLQVDARIVRLFNCYGPRMHPDDGRVISTFIVQALAGKPLTIFGTGEQTRSFCYVSDMVEAIWRAATLDAAGGEIINIGNPRSITIRDLARLICDMAGVEHKIEYHALPEDDPTNRCPDVTKAERILAWRPSTELPDGLRQTLEYIRQHL